MRGERRRRRSTDGGGAVQQSRAGKGDGGKKRREGKRRKRKKRRGQIETQQGKKGEREKARVVRLAGWYRGKSEGEETKQKGGRGRVGEETVYWRRAKKEKYFVPFSLRRSPSGTALFVLPSFARPRYTGWMR